MKLYILIALAIHGASAARIVRDAPSEPKDVNFLDTIQTGLSQLERVVFETVGSADTDELKKKAGEHIDILTQQFSLLSDMFTQEAEHLKQNEVVKDLHQTVDKHVVEIKGTLDQRIAKFKEEHPDTYSQISHHVETVKNAGSTIAGKIDSLAKSDEAEKLKDASIKFIDDAKNALLGLLTQLKTEDEKKE